MDTKLNKKYHMTTITATNFIWAIRKDCCFLFSFSLEIGKKIRSRQIVMLDIISLVNNMVAEIVTP